jgi:hypothetical protein
VTVTPRRARGVIDDQTGALLAVSGLGISWLRAHHAPLEVTPDFVWGPVAAGGGAIAVAGSEYLQWYGADDEVRTWPVPIEDSYRLAVAGRAVTVVNRQGELICWQSANSTPHTATVNFEADGLVVDQGASRVAVWGWDTGGDATMTVFAWDANSLTEVEPVQPWPSPLSGVAFLAEDVTAVGGPGSLILLSPTGERLGAADLSGLERLTGSASGVAWIRSVGDDRVVAGIGSSAGQEGASGLTVIAEAPIPSTDPFPEIAAVTPGELVLVAGLGPHTLAVHRLTGDGWAEPTKIKLPTRANPAT